MEAKTNSYRQYSAQDRGRDSGSEMPLSRCRIYSRSCIRHVQVRPIAKSSRIRSRKYCRRYGLRVKLNDIIMNRATRASSENLMLERNPAGRGSIQVGKREIKTDSLAGLISLATSAATSEPAS